MGNSAQKVAAKDEQRTYSRLLESSSALAFARSLFHGAEGVRLFEQGFAFASAVSTYYSVFQLSVSLILAYCTHPESLQDCDKKIRETVEKIRGKWATVVAQARPLHGYPDPGEFVRHNHAHGFLKRELPEVAAALGRGRELGHNVSCRCPECVNLSGTLRDMREFVDYAPRMLGDPGQNILFSWCQYTPQEFRRHLQQRLAQLGEHLNSAVAWMSSRDHRELILGWDFVLWKFMELASYQPRQVTETAWSMYRSILLGAGEDWRTWPNPIGETWSIDGGEADEERNRYEEAIRYLSV
jgi:hypothetical protein